MKKNKHFLQILIFLSLNIAYGQTSTGSVELLKNMYNRYHGNWHKTLKFDQTTERYRNDSLIRTELWHEYIQYPDKMRIDIGDPSLKNAVIYANDSSFVFRGGKITRKNKGENELIFFLGGMYFMPLEKVFQHYADLNFDLSKFHSSIWDGKKVYVIGSNTDDEQVNQLWIDADRLVAVRYFKYENGQKEEATFEDHIALKRAWSETKSKFYFDNKIFQVEYYKEIVAGMEFKSDLFDPEIFSEKLP